MPRQEPEDMLYSLAGDLGGTQMRTALVDESGRIRHRQGTPTDSDRGVEDVLGRLVRAFEEMRSLAGEDQVVGVGVALAGPTDPVTGTMFNPPHLPDWHGFTPKPALEERLSLRATLANDATLAALAEHRYGAGRGYRHMIYMTVSTGIGGGIVIDGRLYAGAKGFAGELGHMTIDRRGPKCSCGNVGCLEALASGTAVARVARERLKAGGSSLVLEYAAGDPAGVTAKMIADAARAGDEMSLEIMAGAATNLGIGIVSLMHAFDPQVIVIGGGMSEAMDLLLPGIDTEVDDHVIMGKENRVGVVKSELGDDVGLLGAAAAAFADYEDRRDS